MEWIKPGQLPTSDTVGVASDTEHMLSFAMLRALIAARQSVSAARCATARASHDHGGQMDDPQSIMRIFATDRAVTPQAAPKSGPSDA